MIKFLVLLLVVVLELVSGRTLSDLSEIHMKGEKNCTSWGEQCATRDECCGELGCFPLYNNTKPVCRGSPPPEKATTPKPPPFPSGYNCSKVDEVCWGHYDCCSDYQCDKDNRKCVDLVSV